MILQRIRIIAEDAGFEPGTFDPVVWCATTSSKSNHNYKSYHIFKEQPQLQKLPHLQRATTTTKATTFHVYMYTTCLLACTTSPYNDIHLLKLFAQIAQLFYLVTEAGITGISLLIGNTRATRLFLSFKT